MSKPIKIAATVFWACTHKLDNFGKYSVVLGCLSDKAVEALGEIGIKAREDDQKPDQGKFIACKSTRPITVVDENGDQIDGKIVGNGSKAVAVISTYEWAFGGRKGLSPSAAKIIVTDLKEYTGGDETPKEDEDEVL